MSTTIHAETRHRVLLVDDDRLSLEVTSLLLGHDGHHVMKALDGETALRLIADGDGNLAARPDVLLVDLQMPGVTGDELAKRIRARPGPKPLILAMSATEIESGQLGFFDGFLLKPLSLNQLRDAMQSKGRAGISTTSGVRSTVFARPEPMDWAIVGKLRTVMSENALMELYTACLNDSRARARTLEDSARRGDMKKVREAAHQIKGAACMVGATRIAGVASRLELESCTEEDTLGLVHDLLSTLDELERMLWGGKIQIPNEPSDR